MIVTTKWGTFEAPDGDHIGRSMVAGRHYESQYIERILASVGTREGCAVDVGANIGTHAVVYARWFSSVVAFEPHPTAFNYLEGNLLRNACRNVVAHNVALGEAEKTAYMRVTDSPNLGGARIHTDGVPVQMRTLDSFELKNVVLLKVDVEGYESNVFDGAKETLERCRPVVAFEHLSEEPPLIFAFLMTALAYDRILSVDKNFIAVP